MLKLRLATGELQPLTERTALTNEIADGLLVGTVQIVCVAEGGSTTPVDACPAPAEASGRASTGPRLARCNGSGGMSR